jgi:hypothetical protein
MADAAARVTKQWLLYFFGPNAVPVVQDIVGGPIRDLSALLGPPIAAHFSDVPIFDSGTVAPSGLFPWVAQNWPQDLSVRPIDIQVEENYSAHTAFVKLIGTVAASQAVWSAWYPTDTFDANGIMKTNTPGGTWNVQDSFLLPDITIANNKWLSWQYLWEIARRLYLVANSVYSTQIDIGLSSWLRLNDIFLLTRQNAGTGPKFSAMPFYTTSITINIDLAQSSWRTTVQGSPITNYGISPIITPPYPVPN